MRNVIGFFALLGSLCLPAAALAELRVVATVPTLAAIAREVGGSHVRVTSLSLPTQDPHFVDARPNLALELSRADVLLVIGLGLESGWLPTLQTGSRNGAIQTGGAGYVDTSSFVRLLEIPAGRIDRSMGDVHPGGNPHFLFDPRAAVAVARGIAQRFAQLDSRNAAAYDAGARTFAERVQAALGGWQARVNGLRGANVVAYHASFPYLAEWLGLRIIAHIEPRPGVPPSPAHVASLLGRMSRERVRVILQEGFYPDTTARLLSSRTGAALARIDGGADFARGESYAAHIGRVIDVLARAGATR